MGLEENNTNTPPPYQPANNNNNYGAPYPPQQNPYGQPPVGYYQPQQPYGGYQDAAVIVGVAPVPIEHRPMVEEPFGHQMKKLPHRMGRMFSKPNVHTFEDLKYHASWAMTFFLLFVQVTWAIVLGLISWKIAQNAFNDNDNIPSYDFSSSSSEVTKLNTIAATLGFAIMSSLGFFIIMNACFHGVAMCLGGGHHNGQSSSQMFLQLCFFSVLFGVPLDLLSVLGLIPVVGVFIGIALFIIRFVFFVLALQAIYNISTGHAIGIIICFVVIMIVVIIVIALVFVGSIFAFIGAAFSH